MSNAPTPAIGDVIIAARDNRYYLSICPNPPRLSFAEFERAWRVARLWAAAQGVDIWRDRDGTLHRMQGGDVEKAGGGIES